MKRYLLSVKDLESFSPLEQRCLALLDPETCRRAEAVQNRKRRAEIIGGGLLLQLALLQMTDEREQGELVRYEVPELVDVLEKVEDVPFTLEFSKGSNGKPSLKNYPLHYNLSHSGEYVFCVAADCEVGADIQRRSQKNMEALANRFFSKEEKDLLAECSDEEAKSRLFFKLWCRKEAWAKLQGNTLVSVLEQPVTENREDAVLFEEYELGEYQLVICHWKREK